MLRNYLVVAVRNLLKNKILSMINVLGLVPRGKSHWSYRLRGLPV